LVAAKRLSWRCAVPIVIEPQTTETVKTQSESSAVKQPELFAAEIAMEEKSSNFLPILLIAALVIVVGGTIVYFVKGSRDVLTVPTATTTVSSILKAQGPATIHFSTGAITASVNEKPLDPHYKLLAKAGIVVTKHNGLFVTLTPAGEKLLSEIEGVQKTKNRDDTTSYVVPLAERKLVEITNVTMIKPHLAQATYSWKWAANRLGENFDASGSLVQSFNTWERGTLIKTYGVDFYHAAPTKTSIVLIENDNGTWKAYVE
jgi:hypothetical protein